jgi:hypothetical protein
MLAQAQSFCYKGRVQIPFRWGSRCIPAMLLLCAGCATTRNGPTDPWPQHILRAEQIWQLNPPGGERFDASGLLLARGGEVIVVSDLGAVLYRIEFLPDKKEANLFALSDCFTSTQLAPFAREKVDRYDCEGIAQDEQGRIYLCEEANRWILRCDPAAQNVERLRINWSPVQKYFSQSDRNASFEGIAVGSGRLYVANERDQGRIIVVDLASLEVIDDFLVRPKGSSAGDVHYSDLCWFDGALYVLLRERRAVLKVEPRTHRVLAEYDFGAMETNLHVRYLSLIGQMEGLAVDQNYFWLVTDNNGISRILHPTDNRPTLFKCRRPDVP